MSSGQLQKISFIRSLLSDVDILLLDESTSNLDENSRKLIFDILNKSNFTILNCTHNHQDFDYDEHLKIVIKDEKRLFKIYKPFHIIYTHVFDISSRELFCFI